jgi:plastocyanin domain-containing protein
MEEEKIVLNKKHVTAVAGVLIITLFFVFAVSAVFANANVVQQSYQGTPAAQPTTGEKQVIKLTLQGSKYQPYPITVKKGVPVELDVDTTTVTGCMRGIQIPAFGVRKQVSPGDNKIVFTPDKAGTFSFSCFMGMGQGRIVVQDENGNVPANTVQVAAPSGGSCGAGGGGCGCGGGLS